MANVVDEAVRRAVTRALGRPGRVDVRRQGERRRIDVEDPVVVSDIVDEHELRRRRDRDVIDRAVG